MLPIRCECDASRLLPVVTTVLILACVAVFVRQEPLAEYTGGIVPAKLFSFMFHPDREPCRILTIFGLSLFSHANLLHLVGNIWYLWIFGCAVERSVGHLRYLVVYLVCGVLSMLFQAASSPYSIIPIIGASGAIAGIMGMHLVMHPLSRILTWVFPIFLVPIPSLVFLIFWIGLQYFNFRGAQGQVGGVAWVAHLGGFAAGICAAVIHQMKGTRQRRARSDR
jgi:membrane associated rhomboid family serine protease